MLKISLIDSLMTDITILHNDIDDVFHMGVLYKQLYNRISQLKILYHEILKY